MPEPESGQLALVQRYQELVEAYEALDSQIDELVSDCRDRAEQMSDADLKSYRKLARKRSELLNDMRLLEQQLNLTGDDAPGAN
ncbi:MAG: hypothetical protein OXI30_03960 [Chloroflexota bacterium]|nr:hypothetical protein [Chloroflexota bacterium]MYE27160.1 hypothetical protein [Chloroflexota bacterium]